MRHTWTTIPSAVLSQNINQVTLDEVPAIEVVPPDTSTFSSLSSVDETNLASLISRLKVVFEDVAQYKQLLSCREARAQKLLNLFQGLLDAPGLDTGFRRSLIVAAQRLSKKTGLYPTCYNLRDVQYAGDPVAAGSFGDIYKGSFRGQSVCIKVIRVYQTSRVEYFLTNCAKEALLWGQLAHPNVCPIYGLYRLQSRICLVSPWMDNGDLNQYLEQHPQANRPLLVCDAARGLSYLHESSIIHGDLKGANILVSASGRARLADFGLSSVSDANILAWTSNSSAVSKGGSVRWQAPELFNFDDDEVVPNSEASDIYAWSCVCYEAFTGSVPFSHLLRDTIVMLQVKAGSKPPRPPDSSDSWGAWGLTQNIWSIMMDCWEADPSLRPNINRVISSLSPELHPDRRPSDDTNTLSPARFREEMGADLSIISADVIEGLFETDSIPGLHLKETSGPNSPAFVPTTFVGDQESPRLDPKTEMVNPNDAPDAVEECRVKNAAVTPLDVDSPPRRKIASSSKIPITGTPWPPSITFDTLRSATTLVGDQESPRPDFKTERINPNGTPDAIEESGVKNAAVTSLNVDSAPRRTIARSSKIPINGTPWPPLINFDTLGNASLLPPFERQNITSQQQPVPKRVYPGFDPFMAGRDYGPILDPFLAYIVGARPTFNPIISSGSAQLLNWDMLFKLKVDDPSFANCQPLWDGEPATYPRLTSLKIVSEAIPWVISIHAKDPSLGVTCWEVIDGVGSDLTQRASKMDFNVLSLRKKELVSRAYHHNRKMPHLYSRIGDGMRRLDYLGTDTMFGGFYEDDGVLKKVTGSAPPCTYVLKCLKVSDDALAANTPETP